MTAYTLATDELKEMLVEVAGHDKQRQVRMMEADWERAFADFQELMTVS